MPLRYMRTQCPTAKSFIVSLPLLSSVRDVAPERINDISELANAVVLKGHLLPLRSLMRMSLAMPSVLVGNRHWLNRADRVR